MGLLQEKLSKNDNKSDKIKFKDLSELGIPDIFIDMMLCQGFSKSSILTVILTCCNALVPYFLFKGFVIVET